MKKLFGKLRGAPTNIYNPAVMAYTRFFDKFKGCFRIRLVPADLSRSLFLIDTFPVIFPISFK